MDDKWPIAQWVNIVLSNTISWPGRQ